MLFFKDESIYQKCKYTIILRLLYQNENEIGIEIEYLDKESNWHSLLPFEDQLKLMSDSGEDISEWNKYTKWQKRKKYTNEEFDRIFINN